MAMTYDTSADGVLLFGGAGGSNRTWTLTNGNWTELYPTASPAPRARASMAYDNVTGQALLFGGETGSTDRNDTWTFSGGAWTEIPTRTAPSPRYGAALTYDARAGYFLLFGGLEGKTFLNDTWKYENGQWTNLTDTLSGSPPARFAASLAYDPLNGTAVLFGGVGISPVDHRNQTLADTWVFSGGAWKELHPHRRPPPRWFADLSTDPSVGGLLLFGGLGGGSTRNDTWAYGNGTWSQLSPPRSPPARFLAGTAYDPTSGTVVLFGGLSSNRPHVPILGDTWTFRDGTWVALRPYTTDLVKFSEFGLPLKTRWSVEVAGKVHYTRAPALSLYLTNGTYNFTVSAPGYVPTPAQGDFFTIGGGVEHHPIHFTTGSGVPLASRSSLSGQGLAGAARHRPLGSRNLRIALQQPSGHDGVMVR